MVSNVRGGQHDVRGGLHRNDRILARHEEPALGAHLVTPRLGFAHHGIYVGGGRVVHYGSFTLGWRPVEEVSLARFARGHAVWVRPHATARFTSEQVVERARSRLGEGSYRLFTNNCEHFCEWCVHGEHRSYQVDYVLALLTRAIPSFNRREAVTLLSSGHTYS
jgi:hypothetical protein